MAHSTTNTSNNSNSASKIVHDFILGGTSGAIAKTLTTPIERVKLLLPTQYENPKLQERPYPGITNFFQRYVQEYGVLSLWRGSWANVLRYFHTQAINFSVRDALNRQFLAGVDSKTQKGKYFVGSLLSGGLAGSFNLIFVYPLDFARTRFRDDIRKGAGDRKSNSIFYCCKKILQNNGISGLYQGFSVYVPGIFTYRAFYFGGYDAGKSFIWGSTEEQKKASFLAMFAFAQFATSISETLAYPLTTIRRRLMIESGKSLDQRHYKGAVDCGKKILSQEGVTGLFKGNLGNLSNFYRIMRSSLVLVLYDEFQKILDFKDKA